MVFRGRYCQIWGRKVVFKRENIGFFFCFFEEKWYFREKNGHLGEESGILQEKILYSHEKCHLMRKKNVILWRTVV